MTNGVESYMALDIMCTRAPVQVCTHTHARTHTHTHTCTQVHTCTHTHTYIHTYTHTHVHTHTLTLTHTPLSSPATAGSAFSEHHPGEAVDGLLNHQTCWWSNPSLSSWWSVDLETNTFIRKIRIYNSVSCEGNLNPRIL